MPHTTNGPFISVYKNPLLCMKSWKLTGG